MANAISVTNVTKAVFNINSVYRGNKTLVVSPGETVVIPDPELTLNHRKILNLYNKQLEIKRVDYSPVPIKPSKK